LRPALSEGASIPCPRCGGSGHIRDTESSALQILRIIQEESLKDNTASVLCQVPVEVASFLLNEKRTEIAKIELKQRINVLMVPNKTLETPNYRLERLKHDDPRLDNIEASYKMAEEIEDPTAFTRRSQEPTNKQTPVIKGVLPDAPAPQAAPRAEAQAGEGIALIEVMKTFSHVHYGGANDGLPERARVVRYTAADGAEVSAGDALNLYFRSAATPVPNRVNWKDPETDELLARGSSALDDKTRADAFGRVQTKVEEAAVWIPLSHEPLFLASGAKLKPMRAHGIYGAGLYKGLSLEFK
jgi:hypothetical protein